MSEHLRNFFVGLAVAVPSLCVVAIAAYFWQITVITCLTLALCGAIYGLGHSIRSARATGEGEGNG